MTLPTSRNTTYTAGSQLKSADLNDIQDKIIDNYGILTDTAVALGGATAEDLPTSIIATRKGSFALSVFRLVSGTAPTVQADEAELDFGAVAAELRIPINNLRAGSRISEVSVSLSNDGNGTLTVRLMNAGTELASMILEDVGTVNRTDNFSGTPYVVQDTDILYWEISGAALTGTVATVTNLAMTRS